MIDASFSIAGQVALVTGATGGIGADLAAAFGRAGARVGVAGRRMEAAEAIVARIRDTGGRGRGDRTRSHERRIDRAGRGRG